MPITTDIQYLSSPPDIIQVESKYEGKISFDEVVKVVTEVNQIIDKHPDCLVDIIARIEPGIEKQIAAMLGRLIQSKDVKTFLAHRKKKDKGLTYIYTSDFSLVNFIFSVTTRLLHQIPLSIYANELEMYENLKKDQKKRAEKRKK